MLEIFLGILAFIMFMLYRYLSLFGSRRWVPILMIGGIILFIAAASLILKGNVAGSFASKPVLSWISVFGAFIFLFCLLYILFFADPCEKAYFAKSSSMNSKWYILCRHPAELVFLFLFLSLYGLLRTKYTLYSMLSWSAAAVLCAIFNDMVIFPKIINNFKQYKKSAPFLIPTPKSIKNTFKKSR